MSSYHFVDSDHCRPPGSIPRIEYELIMRQQPLQGKIFLQHKEKERRPIDPPPIIQLKIKDEHQDPCHNYLQSPHIFVCAELLATSDKQEKTPLDALGGTTVSSLHRLKDIDNSDGGFFVFGDLSVKREGEFRLRFHLFEVRKDIVCCLESITSNPFKIYTPKQFPGMLDSTFLSRSFSDQGVRIRIRKEHRIQMKTPRNRAIVSPEQQTQYTSPDPHVQASQTAPRYTAGTQGNAYAGRPLPEQNYPGGPTRIHSFRQEYHPYRPSYAPQAGGYYERHEMHYPGAPYTMISPGSHTPRDYGAHPNYPTTQPVLSPSGEPYYMLPDARVGPLASHHYHDYPEERNRSYPEGRREPPPFQSPFPPDPANPAAMYKSDPMPAYSYGAVSPSMRYLPSDRRPPPHHYPYPPYYQSYESPRIRAGGPPPQGYPSQLYNIHGHRESRHSIGARLTEDVRLFSPVHGSGAGSESSSMGRSTPNPGANPSRRGSMEDLSASVRLPPLRNGSNSDRQIVSELSSANSNSNLRQLVNEPAKE